MSKHVWQLDEDGEVEHFDSGDYHSGPQCVVCRKYECSWCRPEFLNEDCPERLMQDTLPGLDYDE